MNFHSQERSNTSFHLFTMAPSAKQFSFVLLMVVLFTSVHVQARDGEFFFVSLHHSHHKKMKNHERGSLETPTPEPAPAPVSGGDIEFGPVPATVENGYGFAPAPAPSNGDIDQFAPTPLEGGDGFTPVPAPAPETFGSDNPYGLYGKDNEENEVLAEEFNSGRPTEFNTPEPYNKKNNNGYANNYNNNGYSSSTVYNNNNGYSNNYNNNGYSRTIYNNMAYSNSNYNKNGYDNNGYDSEKQGMSDTRFLENGRYYYDVNQESSKQNDRYESLGGSSSNEGYHGEKSKYEFDSMEVYEREQGYSP